MAIDLNRITLGTGPHSTRTDGVCFLEAVAWWAGERHTDRPECVSPVLADYGRTLSDALPDHLRQKLVPLIPLLAGTAKDGLDGARGYLALDWLVRTYTPAWLELAGLGEHAQRLRELAPIIDRASAQAAKPAVLDARRAAAAAGDAAEAAVWADGAVAWTIDWDDWNAAWAAGDAAAAVVWDVAKSAAGAGGVVRGVAWAAAGAVAWGVARDVESTALDAARVAAKNTAEATATALQTSAIDLLQRMIRPNQP